VNPALQSRKEMVVRLKPDPQNVPKPMLAVATNIPAPPGSDGAAPARHHPCMTDREDKKCNVP
jgi:hypothetical protein